MSGDGLRHFLDIVDIPAPDLHGMIAVSRAYEQVTSMMDATSNASDQSIQRLGRVN